MEEEKNYTYLLECADGSLYCGWTNHLKERVKAHNEGRGARYTKSRRPVTLVYYEEFDTRQEAMQREWAVKQLSRKEKLRLIADGRSFAGEAGQAAAPESRKDVRNTSAEMITTTVPEPIRRD